jgi:hypothetical protein
MTIIYSTKHITRLSSLALIFFSITCITPTFAFQRPTNSKGTIHLPKQAQNTVPVEALNKNKVNVAERHYEKSATGDASDLDMQNQEGGDINEKRQVEMHNIEWLVRDNSNTAERHYQKSATGDDLDLDTQTPEGGGINEKRQVEMHNIEWLVRDNTNTAERHYEKSATGDALELDATIIDIISPSQERRADELNTELLLINSEGGAERHYEKSATGDVLDLDATETTPQSGGEIKVKSHEVFKMAIFPNPSTDFVNIDLSPYADKNVVIRLSNINGQSIVIENIDNASTQPHRIDTNHLPAGNYFLTVSVDGKHTTQQFMVAH